MNFLTPPFKVIDMPSNSELRSELIKQRNALSPDYIREKSLAMTKDILSDPLYVNTNTLYLYMPTKNEIDTQYLIVKALQDNKIVAVPIVLTSGDMVFGKIDGNPGFRDNRFHILEPQYDPKIVIDKPGLMIVPVIGFCGKSRLGFGKNYYNNYLRDRNYIHTIGVAYSFQEVKDLEREPKDIELDEIRAY